MHLVNAIRSVHFRIFRRVVGETYNRLCAKAQKKNCGGNGGGGRKGSTQGHGMLSLGKLFSIECRE